MPVSSGASNGLTFHSSVGWLSKLFPGVLPYIKEGKNDNLVISDSV